MKLPVMAQSKAYGGSAVVRIETSFPAGSVKCGGYIFDAVDFFFNQYDVIQCNNIQFDV